MIIDTLVLATRNKHKIKEIKALIEGKGTHLFEECPRYMNFPIIVQTLEQYPQAPEVEEKGATLEENAILKAKKIASYTNAWTFADDSGLEVDVLHGAPGVLSARYAGDGCTYEDNNNKLLKALKGIPFKKRTARFRCVIALSSPAQKIWTVEGTLNGFIAEHSKGAHGFGYDPVFYYPVLKKHIAELSLAEKNAISHRALALKNFIKLIQSISNKNLDKKK